jgi:cytochrome c biogenesis protein
LTLSPTTKKEGLVAIIMGKQDSWLDAVLNFFSSVRCGLILLGLVGIAVVLGTLILQRPLAQEGQIEQIYAPQTIRLLNFLGLFDVFHAWWFIMLLALLGANIVLASLERFPQAWQFFSSPQLVVDEQFVRKLPFQQVIPVGSRSPEAALVLAARTVQGMGYRIRPESLPQGTLYFERHRLARLAPYVVHASLLLIFAGAIVDGLRGYRGYISLIPGGQTNMVESLAPNTPPHRLPFTLRLDEAGMETYPDGSPRQYWSRLTLEENGREVLRKRIFVNDPLTHQGIRFFQSNYGSTGTPKKLVLEASWPGQPRSAQTFTLRPGEVARLDAAGTQVELADFLPDFALENDQIVNRSNEPRNPAVRLLVTLPGGRRAPAWILPKVSAGNPPNDVGMAFRLVELEMEYISGLQVAKQPGQHLIWAGCLILTVGLGMALYMSHLRVWGVVAQDEAGNPVLLLGGQPSKYQEAFEARFRRLGDSLRRTFQNATAIRPGVEPAAVLGQTMHGGHDGN